MTRAGHISGGRGTLPGQMELPIPEPVTVSPNWLDGDAFLYFEPDRILVLIKALQRVADEIEAQANRS